MRSLPAFFFLALLVGALAWGTAVALQPVPEELGPQPDARLASARSARRVDDISAAIADVLLERGITRGDIRYETQAPGVAGGLPRTSMAVDVPGDPATLAEALEQRFNGEPGTTVARDRRARSVDLKKAYERVSILLDGVEVASLELYPGIAPASAGGKPRIAIVIDDIGYGKEPVEALLAASDRLTFAVLPYGPFSAELAGTIHRRGAEVMLHLPMEPEGEPGGFTREGMLLSSLPEAILRERIGEALLKVPHAAGVNNHMGSRLTAMAEPMIVVMDELLRRDLFFVDSRTSPKTVAFRTARAAGVPAVERDVFLDDVAQVDAILLQVKELEARARRRGAAVAIGHPYPETVRALQIAIPRLQKDGFELVPVSVLMAASGEQAAAGRRSEP